MDNNELTATYLKSAERIVSGLQEAYRADDRRRIRELEDEAEELERKGKWDQLIVRIVEDHSFRPDPLGGDANLRAFQITVRGVS